MPKKKRHWHTLWKDGLYKRDLIYFSSIFLGSIKHCRETYLFVFLWVLFWWLPWLNKTFPNFSYVSYGRRMQTLRLVLETSGLPPLGFKLMASSTAGWWRFYRGRWQSRWRWHRFFAHLNFVDPRPKRTFEGELFFFWGYKCLVFIVEMVMSWQSRTQVMQCFLWTVFECHLNALRKWKGLLALPPLPMPLGLLLRPT